MDLANGGLTKTLIIFQNQESAFQQSVLSLKFWGSPKNSPKNINKSKSI